MPRSILFLTLVAALARPAGAADASVEQRLDALESRWQHMEAEIETLRALLQQQPAATAQAATPVVEAIQQNVEGLRGELGEVRQSVELQAEMLAADAESRQGTIAISTYGQVSVINQQNRNSTFDAESFELVFSGQPHPDIGFFSELEFERAAAVGSNRGGEVLIEQAYVDYTLSTTLAFRAGVLLVPFGNNEADHYAPLRDVVSRPLSSRLISPSDWTDNGMGLVGHRELAPLWQLDWEAYLLTGLGGELQGYGLRNLRQGFGTDNNNSKALAAHVALHHADILSMGLGVYRGAWDDQGRETLQGIGFDFSWDPAPWHFNGEYLRMRASRANASAAVLSGGYLRAGYDIDRWLPSGWAGQAFPDARLTLVYEYDRVESDALADPAARAERELKHVFGLRYEPDHSWNLKLNREWSSASGPVLVNGDDDAWLLAVGFVF